MNNLFKILGLVTFMLFGSASSSLASTSRSLPPATFYHVAPIQLTQREFNCLAKNIYYEAGGEPYAGKIAVAHVTLNRVKNGHWGHTVCRVVYAHYQFSWTRADKAAPTGAAWQESQQAARDFLKGLRVVGLTRSKYFHATWIQPPHWTRRLEVVAVIGQHRFYRSLQ